MVGDASRHRGGDAERLLHAPFHRHDDSPPDRAAVVLRGTKETSNFLGRLTDLGVEEVQFEHFITETDDVPEYLAAEIAPKVADL